MKRPLLTALACTCLAAVPAESSPLSAMKAELERTTTELTLPGQRPPYYAAYWVVDFDERTIDAVLGALVTDERAVGRKARVELRVGDARFDNTNFAGDGGFFADAMKAAFLNVPFSTGMGDDSVLRRALWLASDANYKNAIETLEKKRAARQSEAESPDEAPSFSEERPVVVADQTVVRIPEGDPAALARDASRVFAGYPHVQTSEVRVVVSEETRSFVSSQRSEATVQTPYAGVTITARTQATDGMPLHRSWSAQSIGPALTLPSPSKAADAAKTLAEDLRRLRDAPAMDDYSGPVLFEGIAAPQIFYELLGEALSGTPAPRGAEDFEPPFARKRGKRVTAELLSVVDDPTLDAYHGIELLGHYLVDDEGREAQRVSLIERGRLKEFLMSRTPRDDARHSNGHGRSGLAGYARGHIGNLIVDGHGALSTAALRRRLLQAVRAEGAEFGMIVRALEERPHASSGQSVPPPELLFKVYPDGREELVRGATFAEMSVRDLKDLLGVGQSLEAYHFLVPTAGFAIPCSVVAPPVLFEDVELRKEKQPKKRPPAWPSPLTAAPEPGGSASR